MRSKEESWGEYLKESPMLIAGPCSAESEQQVLEIAKSLKDAGQTSIFRAGIWKPRTRPGSFEGVGEIGLPWLKKVKQEFGLPVSIEVAKPSHVEKALEAEIDVLWVGARTSANPFAIQDIADSLRGVDIPVLVKNPVNPDVALWIGAIERLEQAGVKDIGAIHRGVSQFEKTNYRNNPEWQMAIKFREFLPGLLLLNDPSHISGDRALVGRVSQMAMNLDFDGLMIETHCNPDQAWSDAAQQMKPSDLKQIIDGLTLKAEQPYGINLHGIEELRNLINKTDCEIIELLNIRMKVIQDIATFKRDNKMTVFQPERWSDLLNHHLKLAEEIGLNPNFVKKIYHLIHQESIDNQQDAIGG